MSAGAHVKSFDILGDALAVMDSDNALTVLRASTGATNWSDQVGPPLTKFVGNVRDGNRLLVSSESDVFTYDIETSTLLDKDHLAKVVNTKPLLVGNILVYGTASGEIFGQIKQVGFRAWGNTIDGAIEVDPVLIGNIVGFVSQTGSVQFVDGVTGTTIGRNQIFDGPGAELTASDTMMFVASLDRSLYGFDMNGARARWRERTDTRLMHAPVYHEGRVYCAIDSAGMVCFDAGTGRKVWTTPGLSGKVIGVRHGRLLVWDGSACTTLDPASGEVIDRVPLKNVAILKTDKFVDGNVYAVSGPGVIAKFSPR
jgi:outer membrane protein assembly factor BamB